VACNVEGLAMGWYSMSVSPERQPIEKTTAEGKYKKPVFVHLLERKLMAIYSSLLFPA